MVNRAFLIGNLTADPEQRFSQDGKCISSFCVACTEKWKSKDGQQQEKTEFLNCVAFGRLGEIMGEYCNKGAKIYVEGKNTIEKWTDKENNTRYSHKIVVREMKMLGNKSDNQGQSNQQSQPQQNELQGTWDADDIPF